MQEEAVPENGFSIAQHGASGSSVIPNDCIFNACRELQKPSPFLKLGLG